ncbi:nitronate monooxygenase family protein [Pseudomonas sp. R5(2019)]|uniref:NAD(P)H-dependent flavin oxidoreductase n=1 Tax=Pseudomonas sp. R5(2019) TaxID=2697566 RepID=UPI001411B4C4|nr:nitronate monooxygenase [Pseudomonas sp. R5(2019)]NBA97519.1 nitronate monooxygenase [Pseudomonas sp. R5(2019)]
MDNLLSSIGVRYPIVQAPMAGTATPALAAAVSNAGGLGSISIAAANIDAARQMIRALRAGTDKPFNVNVFCHVPSQPNSAVEQAWLAHLAPWFAEFGAQPPAALHDIYTSFSASEQQLQLLLEERPAVVSFHLGLPPQAFIDSLKAAGIVLFASATCLSEAQAVQAAGIDVVVAQGIEAGGHRGIFDPKAEDEQLPTLALVDLLVRQLRIPVIAAGGLMDGADVDIALGRGALAAQLGTAFVLCPESSANAAYRQMLGSERAQLTQLTDVISGRPARGMVNRFMREVGAPGHPPVPGFGIAYNAGKQLSEAASKAGSSEFSPFWAGQQAARARALPAAELMAALVSESQACKH